MQPEPGGRRALPDPAVRDRGPAEVRARRAVQRAQRVIGLERAVFLGGLRPRDVLRGRDGPAALGLLLWTVRRSEEPGGDLVRRADVDQVALADRGDHLVPERADRLVLLASVVARLRPLRHVRHQLAGLELPLLAPAVEELDVLVPVQPEVPVRVGGEPVVVAAVEDHGVVAGNAPPGQQGLEAGLVHEIAAHRVLQVSLPVDLDGIAYVTLVVSAGVLVYLDEHHARVAAVRLDPVGVHQDVGSAHMGTSLLASAGASAWRPGQIRRMSRYISQPRQSPKTPFRNAATKPAQAAAMPTGAIPP